MAFDIGGLPDIVEHKVMGYLAKAFDVRDLANGIQYVLEFDNIKYSTSEESQWEAARAKSIVCFSDTIVAKKYLSIYTNDLGNK